ncbi:hypothetical protein BGZ68_009628 [Mortierella alpina]|nr:hypothetical protein BGZ68_009628 [Mortierella alpina]
MANTLTSMIISPQSMGLNLQSSSSQSAAPATTTTSTLLHGVPNFQVQHDYVPVMSSKRIATWRYLQRMYQGGMVLYNTAMLSETELRRGYLADDKIQRRTLNYFLLGTSLAPVLEIPNVTDMLKALVVVVQEYEFFASESKSKMMFLRATSRKALSLDGKSIEETGEYTLLEVRQLPFPLDYVITFSSLCDTIAQVYEKITSEDRFWTLTCTDMFQKIDLRFKKIMTAACKELEMMARDTLADELNALDPLAALTQREDADL